MDDDEFKTTVLESLTSLGDELRLVREGQEQQRQQLSAIVARLDEQDNLSDRIMQKIDRLSTNISLAAQASEQALDAVSHLARRVTKLEHPDGNPPSDAA